MGEIDLIKKATTLFIDETGCSIYLFSTVVENLIERYGDRTASQEQLNQITGHLGAVESLFEQLPPKEAPP